MAKIRRPKLSTSSTSGIARISPAGAAAPLLSSAQASAGAIAVGQTMMSEALTNAKSALYSKVNREASVEFSRRMQERLNNRFDEDGNPTFDTLVADIGQIGDDIRAEVEGKINNADVKARFSENFQNMVSNQQIRGVVTASKLQSEFIRGEEQKAAEEYLNAAVSTDDPAQQKYYQSQYEQMLDTNQEEFSPNEITQKKEAFRAALAEQNVDKLIAQDPALAVQTIANDPQSLGIKPNKSGPVLRKAQAELSRRQAVNNVNLQTVIEATPIDKLHTLNEQIGVAEESGQISNLQAARLRKKIVKEQNSKGAKQTTTDNVLEKLRAGDDLTEFSDSEVNTAYEEILKQTQKQVEAAGGEAEITMSDKVIIAKTFNAPISSLSDEIAAKVERGNDQSAEEALLAYIELSTDPDSASILSLTKDERTILELAKSYSKTQPLGEAIQSARSVMGENNDQRQAFYRQQAKSVDEFKDEAVAEWVADKFDGWFDSVGVQDLPPGLVQDVKNRMIREYTQHGDLTAARDTALKDIQTKAGKTTFNGGTEVMMLPLEKLYPDMDIDAEREQFESDLAGYLTSAGFVQDITTQQDDESFIDKLVPPLGVLMQAAGTKAPPSSTDKTAEGLAARATIQADDLTLFGDRDYRGSYLILIDGKPIVDPETGQLKRYWPEQVNQTAADITRQIREEKQ